MTERLTEDYYDDLQKIIRHYVKSDNIDLNTGGDDFQDIIDKLAEYEIAEEDGRLKKFPIALGSTVYELQKIRKRIQPYIITGVSVTLNSGYFFSWKLKDGKGIYGNINGFADSRIGKTVFLTKEEAEKALRDLKEQ